MTVLKRMPAAKPGNDVTYLWVSQKRKKIDGRRAVATTKRRLKPDPMFVPWGDIVETPLRVLKRLFNRS